MSVTSGFFNSQNGDRKYNAEQMSAIFNGIINDGIFASVGTAFSVNAAGGNNITVGIGRAWFNSIWVWNDSILPLVADIPEILQNRIDAVIIEIDKTENVRAANIKIVKGTPYQNPSRPTMVDTDYINQYPLAYIYRPAGLSSINQANITSMIGSGSCPYVTGILDVINIETIVAQWQAQWANWYTATQEEYYDWLATLEGLLSDDVAGNLAQEIYKLRQVNTITLTTGRWTGSAPRFTQEVVVPGMTEQDHPDPGIIYPEGITRPNQQILNRNVGYISKFETLQGRVRFTATIRPTVNITLGLKGR